MYPGTGTGTRNSVWHDRRTIFAKSVCAPTATIIDAQDNRSNTDLTSRWHSGLNVDDERLYIFNGIDRSERSAILLLRTRQKYVSGDGLPLADTVVQKVRPVAKWAKFCPK
jgi:hypothetical protein